MSYKDKLRIRAKKNNSLSLVEKFSGFDVIKNIIFTEKTYQSFKWDQSDRNIRQKYFFEIDRLATKNDVKFAVKKLYNVEVEDVSTIILPQKSRSRRLVRKPIKKAIVTLAKWQKIEFLK